MSSGRELVSAVMREPRSESGGARGRTSRSCDGDPRIEEAVEDVDEQVGDHDQDRADQYAGTDHLQVDRRVKGVQAPLADAVDVKDLLGEDRAREQRGEVET